MSRQKYKKESEIGASPEEVFAWHEREGAVERLTPPWERVEMVERARDLRVGSRVVFRVFTGPVGQTWVAEHTAYEPPHLFVDEQRRGPFAYWRHEHRFERTGRNTTRMIDEIEYELPLGWLGEVFGGAFTRRKLERMFEYRHRVVAEAFSGRSADGDLER